LGHRNVSGDGNHHNKIKVLCSKHRLTMANSKVDVNSDLMRETTGATVLITDQAADKYLAQSSKHGKARYSRWCGGKGGFDDYAERLH
jgi:hypothetical protein